MPSPVSASEQARPKPVLWVLPQTLDCWMVSLILSFSGEKLGAALCCAALGGGLQSLPSHTSISVLTSFSAARWCQTPSALQGRQVRSSSFE